MERWVAALVLLVTVHAVCAVYLSEPIDGGPRRLLTDDGRELFVHGTNAIVKGPPYFPLLDAWDPDLSFSRTDFEMMRHLGLNGVRLGVMWPGVVPDQRGVLNTTYLNLVSAFFELAAEFDVYVLVDMHQDVLSPQYCGEGVPQWAVNEMEANISTLRLFDFPVPLQKTPFKSSNSMGFPTRQECDEHTWGDYYFTVHCSKAFQQLYTSSSLLEAWGEFWSAVVAQVYSTAAGRSQVLGFELINEPWAGDVYSHPSQIIPGVADKEVLQPAYDYLNGPLRASAQPFGVDPLIFFAAVTFDDAVPAGFTHPPGGDAFADRSVFAFHYYTPPQLDATEQHYFETRVADGARLGTATFLSEFDRPSLSQPPEQDPFCNTTGTAEQMLQSWLFWEWKAFCRESNKTEHSESIWAEYGACITGYGEQLIWNENGTTNALPMSKLARPFAYRVSGVTTANHFDAVSRRFELAYHVSNATRHLPTEVFLSPLVYVDGYHINTHSSVEYYVHEGTGHMEIYADADATHVSIIVTPK